MIRRAVLPALLAGAFLGLTAAAQAARISLEDREHVLYSGGLAMWDAYQESDARACAGSTSDPVYSPVGDGWTLAAHSWRYDGFDNGLATVVDEQDYFDTDAIVTARGRSIRTDPRNTNGLLVSRVDTALRGGPIMRSLVKLRNPSGPPFTGQVGLDSNLGTDSVDEAPRATSSGDLVHTVGDRWVVSSNSPPLEIYDDPALTFALFGKGARVTPGEIQNAIGTGCLTVDFEVTIRPGATRYLLFFAEMNPQPGKAAQRARVYDRRSLTRSLKAGIKPGVRNQILNWDLG